MKKYNYKGKNILEIRSWWCGTNSGKEGYILTDQKEIYHYQEYREPLINENNESTNFFIKTEDITIEKYNKIIKFIEENLCNKEFKTIGSFDGGNTIFLSHRKEEKVICNNYELYRQLKKLLKGDN